MLFSRSVSISVASPRIHSLKSPSTTFGDADAAVVQDGAQPSGLMAPLEQRRAQVHVVEVQRVVADGDVDALAAARLARPPRQVVLGMVLNRQPAHHDIAEQGAAQVARRRHDPAHAEQRAELLGVPGRRLAGANHFLQGDDVGVDAADDLGDAGWIGAAVKAAAAVDVVGGDPERSPVGIGHYPLE